MNEREYRLRRRIDQLTDERDQARTRLTAVRRTRDRLRTRIYKLEHSVQLWRARAKR